VNATHVEEIRAIRSNRERVSELLSRYPRVRKDEVREILAFLRTGRHLDVGLLTSNERLRPNLDAFMEDHKEHFRVNWREGALVIGGLLALLIILWLIWEAFK
jgi:hypothetical protein